MENKMNIYTEIFSKMGNSGTGRGRGTGTKNCVYTVGVDIGGTHTDAVLVSSTHTIAAFHKERTTSPLDLGFGKAVRGVIQKAGVSIDAIGTVCVGTTHATNAILEMHGLNRVGIIRLAGHLPHTIPPCYTWPQALREKVLAGSVTVNGGFECDGRPITSLNSLEIYEACEKLISMGASSFAIVGAFSPMKSDQEEEVLALLKDKIPFPISLSHAIGGIGFIERENATVLNAALHQVMSSGLKKLASHLKYIGLNADLFITQNNGTLIPLEQAIRYPILTIASGQTNSFVGASQLAALENAVIVDIGGTSTDIGIIKNRFPRQSIDNCSIGSVALNFPMPDVISIALGGGSHVCLKSQTIGPLSCARRLFEESVAFGGKQLTFTDMALALRHISIPGAQTPDISKEAAEIIMRQAIASIHGLVQKMDHQDLPVLFVGGGASLFQKILPPSRYFIPPFADVANAYGAALAEVSGQVDLVLSLERREEVLESLKQKALELAMSKGSDPEKTRITDQQVIPYHYMPGLKARVIIQAAGPRQVNRQG
jgi:N-methylhydantoinase A/oxoprolinase/acetone carboxylase beta subunit